MSTAADIGEEKEVESGFNLKFYPPVFKQRYLRVAGILEEELEKVQDKSPKTILDVGCAELNMFVFMKSLPLVEKIIMMDIDKVALERYKGVLRPLPMDHLRGREAPLEVELYAGCITKVDPRVLNTKPAIFAVIAIEIIEHLDPDIGIGFEKTLFSTLAPPVIIITTPNSEYNEAFKLEKGEFRHWDHRFEWTREEFKEWCEKMQLTYPAYCYTIEGIGKGPPEFEHLGCVSQVAVFRKSMEDSNLVDEPGRADCVQIDDKQKLKGMADKGCYELITSESYPFFVDPASVEERILREFKIFVNLFVFNSSNRERLEEEEQTEATYPLKLIRNISSMPKVDDLHIIRNVLQDAGYKMSIDDNGETVVVLPIPELEEEEPNDGHEDDDSFDFDDAADRCGAEAAVDLAEDEDWT